MRWDVATPFARRVLDAARRAEVRLVGGAVRDLLLERPFGDVDLVTERSAIESATVIAQDLGAAVREYPRFLTAKVIAGDEPPVDVATARKETYSRPGALPKVAPGSLHDDLFRRDFTVNAICLDLREERLIDPFGGLSDLRAGTLRLLHRQSFLDDPTRILRGLRLGARLGMSFDDESAGLAREAIDGGALETISRERHWRELLLAIGEEDPAAAVLALVDSGAVERLTGLRSAPDAARRSLPALTQLLARHPRLDREVAMLGALYRQQVRVEGYLAGIGFTAARKAKVLAVAGIEHPATAPLESMAVDAAENPARTNSLERMLAALESPLPFRGGDLGLAPGPHIGKAMRRTRHALAAGEISAEEARDFARRVALQYLNERIPGDR